MGKPLSSCGNSESSGSENYHHKVSFKIIMAVIGSGLAVFVSVTIVVVIFHDEGETRKGCQMRRDHRRWKAITGHQ